MTNKEHLEKFAIYKSYIEKIKHYCNTEREPLEFTIGENKFSIEEAPYDDYWLKINGRYYDAHCPDELYIHGLREEQLIEIIKGFMFNENKRNNETIPNK